MAVLAALVWYSLSRAAARPHESVRAVDVVARLGGDEFGVLLPEAGEDAAG